MTPAEHHRQVAGRFTEVVDGVQSTQWDDPTPVPEWRVRDIVGHLVEWLPGFLAMGSDVRLPPGRAVADDPAGAWRAHAVAVQAVLDDPASASMLLVNPHIGEVAVPDAIERFYVGDVFMHTWDLARATGQVAVLDPLVCADMLFGMREMEAVLRGSGQYGPAIAVADDAAPQEQLMAFVGRDPSWQPPARA